ncbi:hypothetical protein [Chryseobacterium salivictor]|uniref:hypothetical protein n=1 Tax=Chryseobacterium salivictor TaxID=2547600 RepID=UPI001FE3F440|nr:hypothetical protein [Chryseobacterium salivictor]
MLSIETDKAIVVANGEIRNLMVRIENKSENLQDVHLVTKTDEGVRVLNTEIRIKIEPKEKVFVPFKIFIEKRQPAGSSLITLHLQDSTQKTVASWETVLTVEPKRLLRISANDPQILIYRVGDSLKISSQVTNGGNQTEQAEIYATFPQYLGSETVMKKKVTLNPFTSQEVVFSKLIDRDLLKMEIFTVNVAGTNSNKEFFGNTMVTVQNALGSRRYIDPLQNNNYRGLSVNHISWSTSNPFDKFSASHNVDLRTEVNIGNTKAMINLNGTYWPSLDTKMMFQNSWLKLEHKEFGVQLGNLNSSDLEITLNGRGAQFTYTPDAERKTLITAGAVEKSYNIFDPVRLNNLPRGYSAFAKTAYHMDEDKTLDSEVILDTDPFQKSFIIKGGYEYNNRKNESYGIDLGYGHTRSVTDENNAQSSVSLGLNYRKTWDKYAFSSTNYHSSGYYPGIKRGSTVSEQRLSRSFEKFSLYGAYSLNIYDPRNIESLYQFSSLAQRHRAELGSNFTIAKRIGVNMISQLSTEKSDVFVGDYFSRLPAQFNAASLATTFNYSTADHNNRITFTYAQGISYYQDITEPRHIYSFQANLQHRNLMLSTTYQHGNFLLYEGNRNGVLSSETEQFSAVATYRLTLLNYKMNLNLSSMVNLDTQSGKSFSFNSNFDYRLFRSTKIFANYNYNRYSRNGFDTGNTYYQLGVSQDLPSIGDETVKYKNGSIKVFTYYDLNNNNIYEPETDQPAGGVKVKINNTIFISGDDGNIKYRKVPYGEYTVKSIENDWYGDASKIDLQQKEIFLTLPLEKTTIMRGKIVYEKTSKTQYEVQEHLAGIPVLFRNTSGKIFTFYTNAAGEYTAYIPLGTYHVSLESQVLQKNVYVDKNIESAVAEQGVVKILENILLKVKEKKVEVKKFGITD